jgi:hypothetical protein
MYDLCQRKNAKGAFSTVTEQKKSVSIFTTEIDHQANIVLYVSKMIIKDFV